MPLSSANIAEEKEINFEANLALIKAFSSKVLPFSIGSILVKFFRDKISIPVSLNIFLNSLSLF